MNGPRNINTICPVNIPAKTPIVEPQLPAFEPPDFFVKYDGTRLFTISTATHTTAKIMIRVQVSDENETKELTSIPAQHNGVPGSPGMMHPIIPTIKSRAAAMMSAMFMTVI